MWLERRDSCIALFIDFSRSKRSLYASTATWRNAMYVFWLGRQAKPQGKPFSLEDNKNVLDGNELTQPCLSALCLFAFCLSHRCQLLGECAADGKQTPIRLFRSVTLKVAALSSATATVQHRLTILNTFQMGCSKGWWTKTGLDWLIYWWPALLFAFDRNRCIMKLFLGI